MVSQPLPAVSFHSTAAWRDGAPASAVADSARPWGRGYRCHRIPGPSGAHAESNVHPLVNGSYGRYRKGTRWERAPEILALLPRERILNHRAAPAHALDNYALPRRGAV